MSDREAFRERRDQGLVQREAAKLARSKAVAENQVLRQVLKSMLVMDVTWAEDRKHGAIVVIEGGSWFDGPTAEVMERIINELREGVA
jgi:DNA integrity scanning protein DisA with diadenylate cyclase activity